MMPKKFCVDCDYYYTIPHPECPAETRYCRVPSNMTQNLVTGCWSTNRPPDLMRELSAQCGPDGRFWRKRRSWWARIHHKYTGESYGT